MPQVRGRSLLFFLCSLPPFTFFFILSFRARNHDTVNSARMGGQVEGAAHLPGLCDHAGHSNHAGRFPYVAAITIKALCKLDRAPHHGGGPPSLFHFDCLVFFIFIILFFKVFQYICFPVTAPHELMTLILIELILFLAFVYHFTRFSSFSCLVMVFRFLLLSCLSFLFCLILPSGLSCLLNSTSLMAQYFPSCKSGSI